MDFSYPVLEERTLPAVPRRFLRGGRRELAQLPEWRPGSVFVFDTGRERIPLREHTHLVGTEEAVVDAVAVSVIDIRPRPVTAYLTLPSASAADDFTVRVTFRCQVTDPAVVAGHGPTDLAAQLERHLKRDRKLLGLGASHSIEQIADIRDLVESRVEAYWEYHPLQIPGLTVAFAATSVLTPAELRAHEQLMRDEKWRQKYARLTSAGEDAEIERMRDLVADGSAGLTALGLARREIHPADAVRDARENEERAREYLTAAIDLLQKSGHLDYVGLDANGVASAWYEQLTGHSMPPLADQQPATTNPRAIDATRSGSTEEEDIDPPDEAFDY